MNNYHGGGRCKKDGMDGGCGGLRDFWTPFPDWEATKTGPGLLVFLSFGKVL